MKKIDKLKKIRSKKALKKALLIVFGILAIVVVAILILWSLHHLSIEIRDGYTFYSFWD